MDLLSLASVIFVGCEVGLSSRVEYQVVTERWNGDASRLAASQLLGDEEKNLSSLLDALIKFALIRLPLHDNVLSACID